MEGNPLMTAPNETISHLFENDRNYLLGDAELNLLGDRDLLAQWRHKRTGPPFYKLGRKVVYRGSDLNAWTEAQKVCHEQQGGK
jgi:hypothetical protein